MKVDMQYKSVLPFYEQHYNNYEEYIMKTSAAGGLFSSENSIASRIHATKVDPKAPNFKVLSCHSVVSIKCINDNFSQFNLIIVKFQLSYLTCLS
jgi:hypothetical protein